MCLYIPYFGLTWTTIVADLIQGKKVLFFRDISLLIIVLWKNQMILRIADEIMDIKKLRVEKNKN